MPCLYVLMFGHLELVHCHGGAQLLLPRAMARGAAASTAGRRCAEDDSQNEGQRERGGHVERAHFLQSSANPMLCISFHPN